jgi:hypothetical protein
VQWNAVSREQAWKRIFRKGNFAAAMVVVLDGAALTWYVQIQHW